MARHNEIGKTGEALAATWLQQQGFTLLHRNWCYDHYEIDIVASKEKVLHFVEVKTRSSNTYGFPEEAVSRKKISNMMKCSEHFQLKNPQWKRVQFDILSINLQEQPPQYLFIEDIYL